jgi:mycofactocin precursor
LARDHCPVRELLPLGQPPTVSRKSTDGRRKGSDEVTDESPDPEEENISVVDELLVEEVSIDGMCGVY